MKFFCWNVRGLNSISRQRSIRSWVGANKPLFGSLLETHVSEDNASRVLSSTLPGWRLEANYSAAENGHIWVVWDPSISVICLKKSAQLMPCGVHVPATSQSFAVAFVYAYNTIIQRRSLWDDISSISQNSPARSSPWILLGDFNQIVAADEHFSVIPHALPLSGMIDFHNCIVDNDLSELSSRGVFFTWSNGRPEDPILRKLDRVLVNEDWLVSFPASFAVFDPPGDSDHAPCLISLDSSLEITKKTFKYFSFLSSHQKFQEKMAGAWARDVCVGSKLFTLGQRLREVKFACRLLNSLGFGNLQQRAKDSLAFLESVQVSLLSNPSQSLFRQEFVARQKWIFFSKALETFYKQKSRVRWYKDGDANTSFFHRAVVANQARNSIRYLRGSSGERIENQSQIKDMTVSYFQNLLGSERSGVVPMDIDEIKDLMNFRCPQSLFMPLIAVPIDLEITEALFRMPKNKALGPDGFPVEFFLEAWNIVGPDTISVVKEFFISGHLPRRFNSTAITLIPKVTGADKLSQFRPVSCCTTIYKVIARLLKKRLQLFISDVVQTNQVGFVKGRMLCENVLLASELVADFHVAGAVSRGCLQIDLTKAYDSLNWQFLFNILQAIELPPQFISWIKECVSSTSFSIAFNGELIGFFQGRKGLRQGDPNSSLLFVLAMDVLSKKLDRGAINQSFIPHPMCDAPLVTHLSFADDILIFFDGSESSLCGILDSLDEFKAASGLGLNKEKSALFIDGGNFVLAHDISVRVGLQHGSFHVRYLRVPLTSKKLKKQDYQPLLDRLAKRFNSWSVKKLSYAGRLQLIQSVIYSTITFWASIFLLPNQCLEEIEQMCNGYLWRGAPNSARGAKISWNSICTPKQSGGLGLRRRNFIGSHCFWDLNPYASGSWIWRNLCPFIDILGENGPRVTGLPSDATVADAIRDGRWWISSSRSRNPMILLLSQCLPSPDIVSNLGGDDKFLWKIGDGVPSSTFSTSQTWNHLNPPTAIVDWYEAVWFKGRIPKHAFITWLATRQRLNTRDRLISWGLHVPSLCLLCNSHDESIQHIFFDCSFSNEVWVFFTSRARVIPPFLFEDVVRWLKVPSGNKNVSLILKLAFQASIYAIWKERNARLHISSSRPPASIISEIII
ncbi:unnamed protein product [Arabidopsis thaliana]|uniref:Reverse transcriptase domain-containing protein n=1 Tax=Arabidopsis thaliana TaxID=3702 RepID=A0A5S9XDC5_ARATH|nr:unnamed protein product [Arabidopsis thaliana]